MIVVEKLKELRQAVLAQSTPHEPLKGRAWLEDHIKNFIQPRLGNLTINTNSDQAKQLWSDVRLRCFFAVWKEFKKQAEGLIPVFPGRDAWEFEVLARIDGIKSHFHPECSSACAQMVQTYAGKPEYIALDSGYRGSVPKKMGINNFKLVCFSSGYLDPEKNQEAFQNRLKHQVFPRMNWTRIDYAPDGVTCITRCKKNSPIVDLMGSLEGAPKYWTYAQLTGPAGKQTILQGFSDVLTFHRAANVTVRLAEAYLKLKGL